jgi:CRP/FNR family transcriptional regulator, nitrogen oxide reductase regulator
MGSETWQNHAHCPTRTARVILWESQMSNADTSNDTSNLPKLLVSLRNLKSRFLAGLSADEVKDVVSAARLRRYLANSVIVNQEEPADHLFLLISGRARYFYMTPDGRKTILMRVTPGEMFGGSALLCDSSEYLVSTEATKPISVLVWDRATILRFVAIYPRLANNALLIMFDYLVAYRGIHISMTCHSAQQRLAYVLANLAQGIGQKVPEGVELDVRNEELANEANVTPFTASRILGEWQRQGILRKTRGRILVHSPERLLKQQDPLD